MQTPTVTAEQIEGALLQLPPRRRAAVVGRLLKSLRSADEPDAAWIEELEWQLQDWRAGLRMEPIHELLDNPDAVLACCNANPE